MNAKVKKKEPTKIDLSQIATLISGGMLILVGSEGNSSVEIVLDNSDELTPGEQLDSIKDELEWSGVEID